MARVIGGCYHGYSSGNHYLALVCTAVRMWFPSVRRVLFGSEV